VGVSRRRFTLLAIGTALVALVYAVFFAVPAGGSRLTTFDPDRTAALEVDMWQAYYDKRNVALFADLVVMSRERYGYPWATALRMAFHLGRAAATFGNLRADYEEVLPDLEAAYRLARDWTSARYDPAAVARAELAWWVARRVPGQDSADHVGGLIADLNALLYDVQRERVLEASILRAQAGKLRDVGGPNADWPEVARLLQASYRSLSVAVKQPTVSQRSLP
jgi:hypothetical protein